MNKSVKKGLKITGIVLGGLVATILIAVIVIILTEPLIYGEYYKIAEKAFPLPGMNDGYVQQGLTHDGNGNFISSGYMGDGSTSRMYRTDAGSGKSTWLSLKDKDGNGHKGHAGGVAVYGDYVYLCHADNDADEMLVFSLKTILETNAEGAVQAIDAFDVGVSPSFCYVSGGKLYVGEFYREQNYQTSTEHHFPTPAGDEHKAIILAYELSSDGKNGLKSESAVEAYSITDLAQGMCITASGKIVISTSYSIANSHHLVYNNPATTTGTYKGIPLYYLDTAALEKDIVLPPMSEGLVYVSGRVYWIGESASNKYMSGKLLRARNVWSYELA